MSDLLVVAADRCVDCDRPMANQNDYETHAENCAHCETLCWREYHNGCVAPKVDWRARALAAEALVSAPAVASQGGDTTPLTAAERAALRKQIGVEWPQKWEPIFRDGEWTGAWGGDADGAEDLEIDGSDSSDYAPHFARFIADVVNAAPRMLDEIDRLEARQSNGDILIINMELRARVQAAEAAQAVAEAQAMAYTNTVGAAMRYVAGMRADVQKGGLSNSKHWTTSGLPEACDQLVVGKVSLPHETQRTIARWAQDTFGDPTSNLSIAKRALTELQELIQCLEANDNDPAAVVEAADVEIVLTRLYERFGSDRQAEVDKKMAINRARRWTRGGDGHGKHIKDAP